MGTLKNVPQTKSLLANDNYPYEIVLSLKDSWAVTTSVLRDYPLLATGPSTFYLNFTRYRPLSLNNTDLWNIRFDKPFNEILNVTSELGLLGLIAAIYLAAQIAKVIKQSTLAKDENAIIKILGIAVATTSMIFFFTYATNLSTYVMVLLLAILVRSFHLEERFSSFSSIVVIELTRAGKVSPVTELKMTNTKDSYLKYILVLPCLAIAGLIGYTTTRGYISEFLTRSSMNAAQNNDWNKVYTYQENAIKATPGKDTLYTRHAQTALILANSIATKENLTDEDKTLIQDLISRSISASKVASETINPLNVRNWETRALIYQNLTQVAENATDWAIASYNIAIQLDPTNPRLRLDVGGLYYAKKDYLSAASQFRQAISLKGDYANAYYNFGQALYQLGDYVNAKSALETARSFVSQDTEDYRIVSEEIDIVAKKIEETGAGTANQKPTIEQIEANGGITQQDNTQEPLTTAGETKPTIADNMDGDTLVETNNTEAQPTQGQ